VDLIITVAETVQQRIFTVGIDGQRTSGRTGKGSGGTQSRGRPRHKFGQRGGRLGIHDRDC
jgi:hypothetical protein